VRGTTFVPNERAADLAWGGRCFGVDLDGDRIYAVKALRRYGRIRCQAVEWRDPQVQAECRRARSATAGLLLQRESLLRWVPAQFNRLGKARRIFPSLLDIQLPFPLEECEFLFPVAQRVPGGGVRGLAVLARRPDIEQRLAALQAKDVDPLFLDQESLALWEQSLRAAPPDGSGVALRVVVYLGSERVTVVAGRGRDVAGATSMGAWQVEQVLRFVRALLAAESTAAISWFWAGPRASDRALIDAAQEALARELTCTFTVHADPAHFLARAAAIRALGRTAAPCNLRRGARLHPRLLGLRRRQSMKLAGACLAAGLALCALQVGWRASLERQLAALQSRINAGAAEIVGAATLQRGLEVLQVGRALEARAPAYAPFLRATEPSLTVKLQNLLQAAQELALDLETLDVREDAVAARGTAGDWERCEQWVRRLTDLGYRARAERLEGGTEGRLRFAVHTREAPRG
jgi:hypothetical protein